MFCSGCGQALLQGQPVCPQCGRPVAPVVPPVPGMQFQLESYAGKLRALTVVWALYAGYSVLKGMAGLAILNGFFTNHFGNWNHGPWSEGSMPPEWLGQAIFHVVWVGLLIRVALALVAAWGLHERTQWGRIVAIVAAILNLLHPFLGTALGIWTLVVLLGYRNSTLYEQLSWNPQVGNPQVGPIR
jgi:hypothetical protein